MKSELELVVKLVAKLGLHSAALRLGIPAAHLRSYADGTRPVPPEVARQCADAWQSIAVER